MLPFPGGTARARLQKDARLVVRRPRLQPPANESRTPRLLLPAHLLRRAEGELVGWQESARASADGPNRSAEPAGRDHRHQ